MALREPRKAAIASEWVAASAPWKSAGMGMPGRRDSGLAIH